jgi:hypothetical protein
MATTDPLEMTTTMLYAKTFLRFQQLLRIDPAIMNANVTNSRVATRPIVRLADRPLTENPKKSGRKIRQCPRKALDNIHQNLADFL